MLAGLDGYRESKTSSLSVLQDLQARGLQDTLKLVIGDGALGFWVAVNEAWPQTRGRRAAGYILSALSDSIEGKVKAGLKEIWMVPTQVKAVKAFEGFARDFEAKYPKAIGILTKDRESLLAFYDLPAEHGLHICTTIPIESSFAAIRHQTTCTENCVSWNTLLELVLQLPLTAEKSWCRIRGFKQLLDVVMGFYFKMALPSSRPRRQQKKFSR